MEYVTIDDNTLFNLQYYMPNKDSLRQLANIFGIFADETRLKILSALSLGEMCVNDLSKYLKINQTTISHQLRLLRNFDAVRDRRVGKIVLYSVKNDLIAEIMSMGVDYLQIM